MVKYSLLFLVLLVTTTYAQIGADGTGTVNGYSIGPGADLSGADLFLADLTGADLSGADLFLADLTGADLSGADLRGARFHYSNLISADLTGADLTGADLSSADLRYADLSSADLRRANLWGADLSGANLSNAKVNQDEHNGVYMNYPNNFPGAIFTNVVSQSDYDAVVAERDARPTQAAYNAVEAERDAALAAQASAEAERDAAIAERDAAIAERDARLTMDEVRDLRAGSTMIEIQDGQATLSMEVEQSSDLGIWTNGGASTLQIPIDAEAGKKFFRFKMTE